jgi:selenocysteine lyase/cysteine desulfurase
MKLSTPYKNLKKLFVGTDILLPTINGKLSHYINFDNAASTPTLISVRDGVNSFLNYYSSVHRGTGYKSQLSTWAYEKARERVIEFVGANPATDVCIFGKNTTEAINKLSKRYPFKEGDIVLTTMMEHHSNDLPFRNVTNVVHIGLSPDGSLDEQNFEQKISEYEGRIALVAITGASNVTGILNQIHRIAQVAHSAGAKILVDCAQLAPHRKIEMGEIGSPERLDFIALSAHKMYAPYGTGALVGPKEFFMSGTPDAQGGGTVEVVTVDDVVWADPPDRDEAGSPNVVGAVALGLALRALEEIGMDLIAEHEAELTAYALRKLRDLSGVNIFGKTNPEHARDRLGVIPFEVEGKSHFLIAAILGNEWGIGVRNGCFCAHPLILHLLGLTEDEANRVRMDIEEGNKREMPGLVRASFGLYNTKDEIDVLITALEAIIQGDIKGNYVQDPSTGEYFPENWEPRFEEFFEL